MNPTFKYTFGRLGLFVVALVATWPLPVGLLLKLLIAILASFAASFLLLRRWREEMVNQVDGAVRARRQRRDRLRTALAGDEAEPVDGGSPR